MPPGVCIKNAEMIRKTGVREDSIEFRMECMLVLMPQLARKDVVMDMMFEFD